MKSKIISLVAATLLLTASFCPSALAVAIDFEDVIGPSTFGGPAQTLVYSYGSGDSVTFSGGVVLTAATNFPANRSSVYGVASFGNTYTNPMIITFSSNITNFFLDLYNGWTQDMTYRVYDNLGNSAEFILGSNYMSGQTLVGFAAAGNTIFIESTSLNGNPFDFLIDNVHFNEALPPELNPVPEPSTLLLLGAGLAGLAFIRRKRS